MATLAEFLSETYDLLRQDASGILPEDVISRSITRAIDRYSSDRPRVVVSSVVPGATVSTYSLTTAFATWDDRATVDRIERPVNQMPPEYLIEGADEDYIVERTEAGFRIHFDGASNETFRLAVSVPWTLATLAGRDTRSCAILAAYYCAQSIASYYGHTIDPTIGADIVNRSTKADEWSRRADDLLEMYEGAIAGTKGQTSPIASAMEADVNSILGGRGTNLFAFPRGRR